ncbi:protein-tyrosine phosphatase family protein [Estrella lausannensis]|uniref:Tyrosine specific protein phosphatases domain-containing protein n=1 Tax=Estrella lausannensis TaxID=483423 RepID=A0A0H5DS44_9BACT|nr:hypothetical protein [Estrella lausannensis]CRX39546.1 hypothetical protein ELAC_2226 [Estrella lausannensis]
MLPVEQYRTGSAENPSDAEFPPQKQSKKDKIAKALHSLGALFHSDKHKAQAEDASPQKAVKELKLQRTTSSSSQTAITSTSASSQGLATDNDELDFSDDFYFSPAYTYTSEQLQQIEEIDSLWTERWGTLETLEKFESNMHLLVAPHQHLIPKVNPLEPSGTIYMGSYPGDNPYDHTDLGAEIKLPILLKELGINQIVCLQKQDELDASFTPYQETALRIARELKLTTPQFLHFGIRDVSIAPDNDVYHFVLETLLPAITKPGMKTYIHCWGGNGRTGTISSIVLAALFGLDAETALKKVNTYHKIRINPQYNAPETETQKNQVRRLVPKIVAEATDPEKNER